MSSSRRFPILIGSRGEMSSIETKMALADHNGHGGKKKARRVRVWICDWKRSSSPFVPVDLLRARSLGLTASLLRIPFANSQLAQVSNGGEGRGVEEKKKARR